jgi:hypothetical protein
MNLRESQAVRKVWQLLEIDDTKLRSQNNAVTITMPSFYSKMAVEVHVAEAPSLKAANF